LVASAVTGLEAREVAILDETGQLLNAASETGGRVDTLDERSALEQYFRARAETAANAMLEGIPLEVRVNAIGGAGSRQTVEDAPKGEDSEARTPAQERNFRLRVAIRTEDPLTRDDEDLARNAVEKAVALDPKAGDALIFETGPL